MEEEIIDRQLQERKTLAQIPSTFWGLFNISVLTYRNNFLNFLILSIATFTPFVILSELTSFFVLDISSFIFARFFDVIVFISMPFLFSGKSFDYMKIFQTFFLKHFGYVVRLVLIQLCIFFPLVSFVFVIPFLVIPLIAVYLLLLYSGFFLIMEDGHSGFSIKKYFVQSVFFAKGILSELAKKIIGIIAVLSLPMLFYSFSIMPSFDVGVLPEDPQYTTLVFDLLKDFLNSNQLKWGKIFLEILLRPLESIFLCFLFISLMQTDVKGKIREYLFKTEENLKEN